MNKLISSLKDNLRQIYRRAIDADNALNRLYQDGKGKHAQIFADDLGFRSKSKRFQPYVEELSEDIEALDGLSDNELEQSLAVVVKKLQAMFETLAEFKASLKD